MLAKGTTRTGLSSFDGHPQPGSARWRGQRASGHCLGIARTQKLAIGSRHLLDVPRVGRTYRGAVSNLNEHLSRVQDIADRRSEFQANEASDAKAFSKAVVDDLGALAAAVSELIKKAQM